MPARYSRLRARLCAATMTALLLLAGCGQKGPLYLPDDESAPAEASEPAAEATNS